MFRKVLVANRGEIAVRVIRALRECGVTSVAVYSNADRAALHVRMADEAAATESYLSIEQMVDAAKRHGCDAVHPGYGFLSENAAFAEACAGAGLVFIGPPAEAIRRMGSKTEARRLARAAGVPVVPGTDAGVESLADARRVARDCGYPVMLKAAAGGGGKGMRRVDEESQLEGALRDASSEAERAFKSAEVYVEKLIERPRHIEIQVFGDAHGNLVHLGERECSIQRRHQKVVEECPSPFVARHPGLRERMGEAAVRAARAAGYVNAGTVEFLCDAAGGFYFLEMNTRLQVEHPVTELVTGLDLVRLQLRVAAGETLGFTQADVSWRGSAIECRVYAEDPENGFFPSPGRIERLREPSGPGVRVDSGVYAGFTVPIEYDPLLAKLACWGATREEAIERMTRAVAEYEVVGIRTNLAWFAELLRDERFRAGDLDTGFIEEFMKRRPVAVRDEELEIATALGAALGRKTAPSGHGSLDLASRWTTLGRQDLLR